MFKEKILANELLPTSSLTVRISRMNLGTYSLVCVLSGAVLPDDHGIEFIFHERGFTQISDE